MSDTLQPHELQPISLLCPSLSPWVCSNSCPLSQWCHPIIRLLLSLCCPPAFKLFQHQGLFPPALCIRWPKYWSFSFNPSPPNKYLRLIFCKNDWFDLLAVQGTNRSLLQHHSLKATNHQHSAFFTVQLSHAYMTTGKTIILNFFTFVGKVVCLLFNMLSRFVNRTRCHNLHFFQCWVLSQHFHSRLSPL